MKLYLFWYSYQVQNCLSLHDIKFCRHSANCVILTLQVDWLKFTWSRGLSLINQDSLIEGSWLVSCFLQSFSVICLVYFWCICISKPLLRALFHVLASGLIRLAITTEGFNGKKVYFLWNGSGGLSQADIGPLEKLDVQLFGRFCFYISNPLCIFKL